ncbi:plasmid pRiA4b ORF-3 family protein [Variovorax guangxiensis]|uniref:plasmid pRiA4b ORF-3 family protein n=1 Tax=Variovorax guangxiensis TaxID=1775474 RepID=UPI002860E843|nr:plasmid pRiA4b ORF-3 family protein [Variovorax guangxiensis]MDR6858644.1 hypothetical protein [Variovorax guangxiensis]
MVFDTDAHKALIGQLKLRRLERFTYEYDFGDLWVHDLRIEATMPLDPKRMYPVCIAGRRAAPPEDCGGPQTFMVNAGVRQASLRVVDRYPLGLGVAGLAILPFMPRDEAERCSPSTPRLSRSYIQA